MTNSAVVPDKNKAVPTKKRAAPDRKKSSTLIIGTDTIDPTKLIRLNCSSLLHHTIIVGQSGSGKSYFVARLIEEILLRTSARIVIIDPNGDFRQVDSIDNDSNGTWKKNDERFGLISRLMRNSGEAIFDSKDEFARVWQNRRFVYLYPLLSESKAGKTKQDVQKLIIHWDSLDDDLQSFLLSADPARESNIALGIETIIKTAKKRRNDRAGRAWFDLQELQKIADEYAAGKIAFSADSENDKAHDLKKDDWHAIHTRITEVRKYQLWHPRQTDEAKDPWADPLWSPPLGLADFVDRGFERSDSTGQPYWDALALSLDASSHKDTLLAVEIALSRLWKQAKDEWRKNAERPSRADEEVGPEQNNRNYDRAPTFVVIDEAHNFAPETTTNPLQARVTENLIRIASEGRKYGLYLILATQRPTKLHKGLVPECENTCLLRVQSDSELDYACQILGYRKENVSFVKSFTGGRGLFNGRWVDNPMGVDTKIAPARTIVGGGGLGDEWMNPRPEPTPAETAPEDFIETSGIEEAAISTNETFLKAMNPDAAPEAPPKAPIAAQAAPTEAAALEEIKTVVSKLLAPGKDVPLAHLANSLLAELSFLKPGDWMGRKSFTELLTNLNIDGVTITKGTPGYAYKGALEDLQKVPENLRPIMKIAHDNLGLVILRKDQFEFVFRSISDELQGAEFDQNIVTKAVQARCALHKIGDVGRPAIDFIVRTLYFSDHSFDSDRPQTPGILAGAFADNIIRRVNETHPIGKEAEQNFRDYFSTALFEKGG